MQYNTLKVTVLKRFLNVLKKTLSKVIMNVDIGNGIPLSTENCLFPHDE